MFIVIYLLSSKSFFFENFFQEHYLSFRVSKSLDSDQDRRSVGPDLDPNYLQRLSADDTSM